MEEVLAQPDEIRQSNHDPEVLIFYRYFANIGTGKYFAVIVKHNERNFILTTYLTNQMLTGTTMSRNSTNNMRYYFDEEADVLYVATGDPSKEDISEEIGEGVVVRRHPESQRVTGFTILNFLTRQKSGEETSLPFSVCLA